MKKIKTSIQDLFIIEKNDIYTDERGVFFESWNKEKLNELNLDSEFKQDSF